MQAVEKLAKLELMAAQLPERIAEARADVQMKAEELGIAGPAAPARNGSGQRRQGVKQAVLAALPGTVAEIRERSGAPTAGATLTNLKKEGLVTKDESTSPATWRRAEGGGA